MLTPAQQARFDSIWRDPDQPATEPTDRAVSMALSLAAEHGVLSEDKASRRDAFYRLKRRAPDAGPHEGPPVDPVNSGAHGAWSVTQNLKGSGSFVSWRYGFSSLENEDRTGLRDAELQLLGLEVGRQNGRTRLTRAELVAMEANSPGDHLFPGFTQRLDIGYINDTVAAGRESERLFARLGRGLTWRMGPVNTSALPYLAAGVMDAGDGWGGVVTAGFRATAYLPLAFGWRAKASVDWNARQLAGLRALHRIEVASPSLHSDHSFGLRAEWRNSDRSGALIGLRWSYRPRGESMGPHR
jgi:hypothetical protein